MRASAVLGSSYGDEGKGGITAFLAAPYKERALVCRFNGGAQAGHTVIHNGKRHVFHHFGAGSLSGAATYLSEYFIVNPLLMVKEYHELVSMGIRPDTVFVHPDALVTTPYEMAINQALERRRSANDEKHGSCGVGIFETINRGRLSIKRPDEFRFVFSDITTVDYLKKSAAGLKYAVWRANELGLDTSIGSFLNTVFQDKALLQRFHYAVDEMCNWTFTLRKRGRTESYIADRYEKIVFEGAQGLLLDQGNTKNFPYLTPSNTGIQNASIIAKNMGFDQIDAYYVTRPYLTRHGAGPFPECDPMIRHTDPTNAPNEFQGSMRFGNLNIDELRQRIEEDHKKSAIHIGGGGIAITCLDQVEDPQKTIDLCRDTALVSFGASTSSVMEYRQ